MKKLYWRLFGRWLRNREQARHLQEAAMQRE